MLLNLAKLFNWGLKKKQYPSLGKVSNVYPMYKNTVDPWFTSHYRRISLLTGKFFEAMINKKDVEHLKKS